MSKWIGLFLLCFVSSVFAGGLLIKEENDVWAIPHTDHYYTQGLDIEYVTDVARTDDAVTRKLYGIRNLMYTPSNIKIPTPQPWDRPWAGLTAATYSQHELSKGNFTTRQIMIGVVGSWSQSEQIQTWFHSLIGSPKPMGWANQIPNEPIANYTWNRINEIWFAGKDRWGIDLTRRYGYSLGNAFVNGEGSFMGRMGWNLPQDYGMIPIQPTLRSFANESSLYVFGEQVGRVVVHNVTLGGSLFQDGPYQDLKPFVADTRFGAALVKQNVFGSKTDFNLMWSWIFRSREFMGQEDNMQYASIIVGFMGGF